MVDGADRATRWLSLSAAAEYVGVHPSTLRDWSERGIVAYLRTPGGHRRFAESDLSAFVAANKHDSTALVVLEPAAREIEARTLQQIHRGDLAHTSWRAAHGAEGVEQKREQGRRLLGLALQYVSRRTGRAAVIQEAEAIGRDYGRDAVARQISLPDTVHAFFFFRDTIIRATRPSGGSVADIDAEDVRIHHDLRVFLDAVFYAMLDAFEQNQRQLLTP
jgi:excisionase family DNA binding protein